MNLPQIALSAEQSIGDFYDGYKWLGLMDSMI